MTQPEPTPPPSQSKKIFAGLGAGAIVGIILLVILGGIGGTVIYQAAQQPNIQATAINIPQSIADPRTSTVLDGRIAYSTTFSYTTPLLGTYVLVFNNDFSTFSSKSISLTYSISGGASHTESFTVSAGTAQRLSFDLNMGDKISGSFTVSGGSGNDIDFYISAKTCTQTIGFSFTLVNSGSSNGYATVKFTSDGQTMWTNRYYVPQGQQVPESGSVTLGDCSGHVENIVVTQQEKA